MRKSAADQSERRSKERYKKIKIKKRKGKRKNGRAGSEVQLIESIEKATSDYVTAFALFCFVLCSVSFVFRFSFFVFRFSFFVFLFFVFRFSFFVFRLSSFVFRLSSFVFFLFFVFCFLFFYFLFFYFFALYSSQIYRLLLISQHTHTHNTSTNHGPDKQTHHTCMMQAMQPTSQISNSNVRTARRRKQQTEQKGRSTNLNPTFIHPLVHLWMDGCLLTRATGIAIFTTYIQPPRHRGLINFPRIDPDLFVGADVHSIQHMQPRLNLKPGTSHGCLWRYQASCVPCLMTDTLS